VTPKQTPYERGVRYERILQKYLESQEYVVTRSAGSHGPVDLIAQNEAQVLCIQVKCGNASDDDENLHEFWRMAEEDQLQGRRWELWHHIKGQLWHVYDDYKIKPVALTLPRIDSPRRKKIAA
jgi:hypothetical protein